MSYITEQNQPPGWYPESTGESGGGDISIAPLTVTENGTSTAPDGEAYNPVTVNVPQKVVYSWHQCPDAVRNYLAYLAENPYSDTDYSTTAILDYAPNPPDQANTKPIGYTVDGVTFRDNEPLVATPFSTTNRAGTLTALDRLRWYNTTEGNASGNVYPRGRNCRDLGGWDCDGGTVRYGLLVRAGELNPVDKELMVNRVGIKTEICLLPTSEQLPESLWGIDRVVNPQELDFQYQTSIEYYKQWKLYLNTALNSVVRGKPVIFHCGAGADKTGTLAVMLMGILGCSQSDIDADFELTMFAWGTQTWRNRTYSSYVGYINKIKSVPLVGGLADTFRNHCISFALSLGITVDEINAFRTAMIDGTPETISAVPSAPAYTNWLKQATAEIGGSALYNGTGYKDGYRLNSSGAEVANATSFVTGYIPVQGGDTVHFYGNIWSGNSGGWYTKCYTSDGSIVEGTNPYDFATAGQVSPNSFKPYDYDSTNNVLHSFTIPSGKNIVAVRFTLTGSYVEGASIITVNEEAS